MNMSTKNVLKSSTKCGKTRNQQSRIFVQVDSVFDAAKKYPSEDVHLVDFLLFTRRNPKRPHILHPGDPDGVARSTFDTHSPTKVLL